MAVPGPVTSPVSAGCHGLIRDQRGRAGHRRRRRARAGRADRRAAAAATSRGEPGPLRRARRRTCGAVLEALPVRRPRSGRRLAVGPASPRRRSDCSPSCGLRAWPSGSRAAGGVPAAPSRRPRPRSRRDGAIGAARDRGRRDRAGAALAFGSADCAEVAGARGRRSPRAALRRGARRVRGAPARRARPLAAHRAGLPRRPDLACSTHARRAGRADPTELDLAVLRSWLALQAARRLLAQHPRPPRRSRRVFSAWAARTGLAAEDPAALLASPQLRRSLPARAAAATRPTPLAGRAPSARRRARRRRPRCATRRCSSCSTPPASGSASCAGSTSTTSTEAPGCCGSRQGRQGADGAVRRAGACAPCDRWLDRRPARAGRRRAAARPCSSACGAAGSTRGGPRGRPRPAATGRRRARPRPARAPAHRRDPPAGGRR